MSAWNERNSIKIDTSSNVFNTGAPGSDYLSKISGTALSGHRMVVLDAAGVAIYADNTDITHLHKVLGMTVGASALGAPADILRMGELAEPSWAWTLNQPIFLGTAGNLTQTPPSTGFSQVVAFPISATSVYVDLREPISL